MRIVFICWFNLIPWIKLKRNSSVVWECESRGVHRAIRPYFEFLQSQLFGHFRASKFSWFFGAFRNFWSVAILEVAQKPLKYPKIIKNPEQARMRALRKSLQKSWSLWNDYVQKCGKERESEIEWFIQNNVSAFSEPQFSLCCFHNRHASLEIWSKKPFCGFSLVQQNPQSQSQNNKKIHSSFERAENNMQFRFMQMSIAIYYLQSEYVSLYRSLWS